MRETAPISQGPGGLRPALWALVAITGLGLGAPAPAQPPTRPQSQPQAGPTAPPTTSPYHLEFAPVAGDVVLAFRPDVTRFPVVGNAVIIPTDDGVVLVDGGGSAAVAHQIIDRIRVSDLGPLRFLIVTHWHRDHTIDLDRYLAAFPDAHIVSHPWTRQRITTSLVDALEGRVERLNAYRDQLVADLETGVSSDSGRPMPAATRAWAERLLADFPEIAAERAADGVGVPDLTTEGGMTLQVGGRRLEVHSVGRANTPGDLVVYLPDEKILIAGDIVSYPVPFGFPTYPSEVVTATERLLEFDFESLVLGHGPVQRDRGYVEKVLALQRRAVGEIRRLHDAGLDEAQIRDRLDLSPEAEAITHGDPTVESFFAAWYLEPIVQRALGEITGHAGS